jgi:Protein of unknown function (DUF4231)
MTDLDDRFKQQEAESKEEKWYRTIWDYIISNEPEDESEYSGEEKGNISEDMKIYLKHRFKKTRKYCKKRVKQSMFGFYVLQAVIIIISAIIPIINLSTFNDIYVRIASSIIGALIVIITGFLQLFKLYEKWILFMSTVDSLEYEYQLYVHGILHYSASNDPDKLFVQKIESVILAKGERYLANIERTKTPAKGEEFEEQTKSSK